MSFVVYFLQVLAIAIMNYTALVINPLKEVLCLRLAIRVLSLVATYDIKEVMLHD